MSFKTAPRYLSGVSVFLGDDITARNTDGELVFFIGQATKGPSVAIDLKTIDNLVPIYGSDNPLVKAAYEFWDGFMDSKQAANLRPVALRIGGIQAVLSTSFGKVITTTDAYDGIENDYFVFIDDTADVAGSNSRNTKMWDKNKQLVYDEVAGINTGHFTVTGVLTGSTNKTYGVDLTGNPTATGTTLSQLALLDEVSYGALTASILAADTAATITGDINKLPSQGTLVVTKDTVKLYTAYTVTNYSTGAISITALDQDMAGATLTVVGSVVIEGSSELNLSDRELYEKYRNALLDVETYTPDYLVPGGVTFDAKGTKVVQDLISTTLTAPLASASAYAYVAAAAQWPNTGKFSIKAGTDGELSYLSRTAQTVNGSTVYALEIKYPVFKLSSAVASGVSTVALAVSGSDTLDLLLGSGFVQIGATATDTYKYTAVSTANGVATLTLASPLPKAFTANTSVKKVAPAEITGTTVTGTFNEVTDLELGIGYVKETDNGDHYSFEWSDEKFVPVYDGSMNIVGHETYNLAHFGYLFAKFCQDASVGYNTPLCGMNTSLPSDPNSRAAVVAWIGSFPSQKVLGDSANVEAVTANGAGLLGDAAMVGSLNFNRCYMSNPLDGDFADPAYGMLLTDEGFIDGSEVRDTYGKVVDLGKFMCVGAGLLTFTNRAKNLPYVDTMGIYALGVLAGTPKNEGISFAKIGTNSNTSITSIVSRKLYNDLVGAGYIVPTREKGLGWVINNDNSACRKDSGYFLISTTRTIKDIIERKRSILVNFIGKPMNTFYYEAAKTKVSESFAQDITNGFLNGFTFTLDKVAAGSAIGKLLLKTSLNPPLELVAVDIDAVIDRNVTNQA